VADRPLLEPAGNRAPDVAVWAVPVSLPGYPGVQPWWQIMVGVHHQGTYREHRTSTSGPEPLILDALQRLHAEAAPDGRTVTLTLREHSRP
jgi:hypothetical protein